MNTRLFLESLLSLGVLVLASRTSFAADAPTTRFSADLVWGTNDGKPPGKELKPIAPDLDKRLRRIFKWKNYFEIERKDFGIRADKPVELDMSKECRLAISNLSGDEFEIQLFGKGVLVVKKRQRIVPGETVVLGGDDKDDNAWFVVLVRAKPDPAP